ncbi:tRNA (adenine(22)-N(1))-methyltransferase [Paenibacillus glufosinatiresistens]|uniref:tRNA (adenine(22)-N(1))-methyltransferase n=1 Tax=Paenibacillus glufosinatiresistens TaxID=3070657 RepID=UPI00286E3E5C|nr:class I SAM-dependent methyltransferase [Paenibacillus sp. YX.27]
MSIVKLSRRLAQLLEQIPTGSVLADIGSDHALLPAAAVQEGRAVRAIAGEVNPGPYEAARRTVAETGLGAAVEVRRGDGLDVVEAGEADCITIAGMGGGLIASILERGAAAGKLNGVKQLLLQPNVGEDIVRRWLDRNGWLLTDERILEEDGKIYEVLAAIPSAAVAAPYGAGLYADSTLADGNGPIIDREIKYLMGPWLLRSGGEIFEAKWRSEIDKMKKIRESLSRSEQGAAEEKSAELEARIRKIAEVLECLPKDRL